MKIPAFESAKSIAVLSVATIAVGGLVYWMIKDKKLKDVPVIGGALDAGANIIETSIGGYTNGFAYLGDVAGRVLNPAGAGFTSAQFVLSPKYVGADYRIDSQWRASIERAHSGIPALFSKLTDATGRVKPEYRKLIGQIINQEVLS